MKVTYYGHSCFSAQLKGRALLFDPFITPNELARAVDVKKIPADCILISHGHQDHMADALDIAKRTGATIVANFEIATWFSAQGAPKIHPMNHGGAFKFDFGRVKLVNAIHSSRGYQQSPSRNIGSCELFMVSSCPKLQHRFISETSRFTTPNCI